MKKSTEKILLEKQDEELVKLIQEGDKVAIETLYLRYKGLIYEVSYKYMKEHGVAQMYLDDLVDIATDGLFFAIKQFTVGQDNSFLNLWWAVVEKRHTTFLQKTINSRIVFFDPVVIENAEKSILSDSQKSACAGLSASIIEIIHKNAGRFSDDERCFLELYILGYKPLEIAEQFSWERNKLYRIKKKAMNKLNMIIKSN